MNILQLKTNLDRSKPVSIVEVANNYNEIIKPSRPKKAVSCGSCNRQMILEAYKTYIKSIKIEGKLNYLYFKLLDDYDSLKDGEFLDFKRVNDIYNKVFNQKETNKDCYDCYINQMNHLKALKVNRIKSSPSIIKKYESQFQIQSKQDIAKGS